MKSLYYYSLEEKHLDQIRRLEDTLFKFQAYTDENGILDEELVEEINEILDEIDYQVECLENIIIEHEMD